MIGAPFADVRASPNFGPRRAGGSIDLLLLHYTAMQSAEAAFGVGFCPISTGSQAPRSAKAPPAVKALIKREFDIRGDPAS